METTITNKRQDNNQESRVDPKENKTHWAFIMISTIAHPLPITLVFDQNKAFLWP